MLATPLTYRIVAALKRAEHENYYDCDTLHAVLAARIRQRARMQTDRWIQLDAHKKARPQLSWGRAVDASLQLASVLVNIHVNGSVGSRTKSCRMPESIRSTPRRNVSPETGPRLVPVP